MVYRCYLFMDSLKMICFSLSNSCKLYIPFQSIHSFGFLQNFKIFRVENAISTTHDIKSKVK